MLSITKLLASLDFYFLQAECNGLERLRKYEKLIVIGHKATDVPLNNTGHYDFLRPPRSLPGDRFTSRSISSSEPTLLNSLMESTDPFSVFFGESWLRSSRSRFPVIKLNFNFRH
jgi:hypothetical protein